MHDIPASYSEEVNSLPPQALTPTPQNRETVGGKWVYTIKSGPNNEETFKATLMEKVKVSLSSKFQMKDLGVLHCMVFRYRIQML